MSREIDGLYIRLARVFAKMNVAGSIRPSNAALTEVRDLEHILQSSSR